MRIYDLIVVSLALIIGLALTGLILPYAGSLIADNQEEPENRTVSIKHPVNDQLEKIPAVILVNSISGPLQDVSVYIDNELKGVTDQNGILISQNTVGIHLLSLKGPDFEKEDTIKLEKSHNTFRYKIQRSFSLNIKVSQIYLGTPIEHAAVEIDEKESGFTNSNGELTSILEEGFHQVKVSYDEFSEERTVYLDKEKIMEIEMVYLPKIIHLEL